MTSLIHLWELVLVQTCFVLSFCLYSGADPGFQVRGGRT